MNPMSIMASAEKLSVPELQRSIQSGVIPAFIGVPLLQEKVKRAKQMQMGMAAQQPKRPSVAEQVGQEARQASVEDMMRERARMMQDEMGQTGGISDFLPKPTEEAYAKGGPIAFRDEGYVDPDYIDPEEAKRLIADRTQLRPTQVGSAAPVMGGTNPADTLAGPSRTPHEQALQPSAPAVGAGAPPTQQAQPQQQQEEKELTLAERMKEYREAAGENKGIGALQNRLSEREARLAKEEDRAPWLALMQAGLATMAGTSPNAMTNIGQGGVAGLQAYTRSMNKLEDAKDKSFDIQAKLEDAQRAEELAALNYGTDSIKTDKAAKRASDLQAQKDKNDMDIAKLRDATDRAQLAITARNANRPNEGTFQQALFDDLVAHGASKADAAKQVLSAGRPYGAGNTFKTGVELRALVDDAQKRLDAHIKKLGFKAQQPSYLATDATYKKLLADRDEAAAAHKQYITENSSYLGGQGTVTPPPAGGVSSGGNADLWTNYKVQ